MTPQLLRFCVTGSVGFVVDAGVLLLLVRLAGLHPLAARFVSFAVAVLVTFELNRRWTFATRARGLYFATLAGYIGVQSVGFVCNFAVYTGMYLLLRPSAGAPVAALGVASAAALLINYLGARTVVFREKAGRARVPV